LEKNKQVHIGSKEKEQLDTLLVSTGAVNKTKIPLPPLHSHIKMEVAKNEQQFPRLINKHSPSPTRTRTTYYASGSNSSFEKGGSSKRMETLRD